MNKNTKFSNLGLVIIIGLISLMMLQSVNGQLDVNSSTYLSTRIIKIVNATHIDKDFNLINNIFNEVKDYDNVWSENISSGEYVRVSFEKNLTNINDITIYFKVVGGEPRIVIYEANKKVKIAEFNSLINETYNRVLLTSLKGSQDNFDLEVVGGTVQFDQIIDPIANDSANNIYRCGLVSSSGSYQLNQSITSVDTCLSVISNDVQIDCKGNTIVYDTGGSNGVFGINASDGSNAHQNLTIKNCIILKNNYTGNNDYGILLNRFNDSLIYNNTIITNGTNDNYGIHINNTGARNNITGNTVFARGTTTNNFGIYLGIGSTNTIIYKNNISTLGTATNYGVYVWGSSAFSNNNNIISGNNIQTSGTIGAGGANNYGIYITANANQNNITGNNITTHGTTANYGIYLIGTLAMSVNQNIISGNNIQALGSTTNNYGINLVTNANQNNITGNNITTNGTTGNMGIGLSGATVGSNGNEISYNLIQTTGTTTNHGIYLITNTSQNNILGNNILANGTTTNYGINLVGLAANPVISNQIVNNSIKTTCYTAASSCHVIYLQNNVNQTSIISNNISTLGTASNYGIYLSGTAPLNVNLNLIYSNNIQTSGTIGAGGASNYGIYITANANQNNITGNNITTNGTTTNHGIYLNGAATTTPTNGNIISSNNIQTFGTGATSNYGIYLANLANQNNITGNNITTHGTTANYGIYLIGTLAMSVNQNIISGNNIQALGSTTNNYGINLVTNANQNNITGNNITTNGTTGNMGIALSGVTATSNGNEISYNLIQTTGTTGNIGISIITNSSRNIVVGNIINANGTTTSYGINLVGSALNPVNNNQIISNSIRTSCFAAASSCHGIYLQNNINQTNILSNNISTLGTASNYGIYLFGTAPLSINYSVIYSNNIQTSGTIGAGGTNNFGIYLTANANQNNITGNNITTNGTTTNHGIYLNGAATTTPTNGNIISSNNIQTFGTGATSNYGIYLANLANQNNITGNNITTHGTTANYGIYLIGTLAMSVNQNIISGNNIQALGSTTNNYGINLVTNANQNNITGNNITTNGTTGNMGIALSGVTATSNGNEISYNLIQTTGTTTNHGIYLITNTSQNNILGNNILANGTTTNYGINLVGLAANPVISNQIVNNSIKTTCYTAASSCHVIYLQNNVNQTSIISNNISTLGTASNYGIYLSGTAPLNVNLNLIYSNNIQTSGTIGAGGASNYGIYITANANQNNITGNNITTNGTTTNHGIYLNGAATTTPTNGNIISSNNIQTFGTGATSNYGIYLANLANQNNITGNNITTHGTTANYGIYLIGTLAMSVNQNIISGNNIQALGSTTNNYGINLVTNANQNNITGNNITTNGTTGNMGIALSGVTATSNGNEISYNLIQTTGTTTNYGVQLDTSSYNNLTSNVILTNGTDYSSDAFNIYKVSQNNTFTNNIILSAKGSAISLNASGNNYPSRNTFVNNSMSNIIGSDIIISQIIDGTRLVDQNIGIYNFTINISGLNIVNSNFGDIKFLSNISGSGYSLNSEIYILNNSAYINTSKQSFNVSANITFNGIGNRGFIIPIILRNSVQCNALTVPQCYNFTSLTDSVVIFNVTNSGNYSIAEGGDVTSPNGTLTFPINGSYSNSSIINMTANVTDNLMLNIATLLIYNSTDDLINQTDVSVYGTNTSARVTIILPDGTFRWSYKVSDLTGNVYYIPNNTLTIDTTNPGITFGTGTEINDSNLSRNWIFVNVSVLELNEGNLTFSLFNSTSLINRTVLGSGIKTISWINIENGNYWYNVSVSDIVNNTNVTETRKITLDTRAPSIFFTYPTENLTNKLVNNILVNLTVIDYSLYNISLYLFNLTSQINITLSQQSPLFINFTNLEEGQYFINGTACDYSGNCNSTNTINITIDSPPLISLLSPVNNGGNNGEIVDLIYDAVDRNGVSSCKLLIDGATYLTNNSINVSQNKFRIVLSPGRYSWSINCTDSNGNENSSETRIFNVIDIGSFGGQTTDLRNVDIENVTNLVINEISVGTINFSQTVNLSGVVSLYSHINISHNLISIDTNSLPSLNVSAILTLNNILVSKPLVLKDGEVCQDCSILNYDGTNLIFSVNHFTNYSIAENSKLSIWDDSDKSGFYGGTIKFYSNYTNRSDYSPISGANCILSFNNSFNSMSYNPSSKLFEYSTDFFEIGEYNYSISCLEVNYAEINLTDTIFITNITKVPNGALVREIESSSAPTSNPENYSAKAGNLTEITVYGNTVTQSWQGYYGNVSGLIGLSDADGNKMYDWESVHSNGEIYASRSNNINFGTIRCANTGQINQEETFNGQESSDVDSISNTFNSNNHPEFFVGNIKINQNNCSSTNILSPNINSYYEVILADRFSNMVYTTILEKNKLGFNNKTTSFEMIVPENGHAGDESTTPYFFYLEIS